VDQIFGNELILSKVLSCLTVKELLSSACRVNHFWHNVCHKVVSGRTRMHHIFELYRIGRFHNMGSNGRTQETHLAEDRALPFVSDCFEGIESRLVDNMKAALDIQPQLVITVFGNFCQHSKRHEKLMQLPDGFRRYLSPDTQFLNLVSHAGVIGSVLHPPPPKPVTTTSTAATTSAGNASSKSTSTTTSTPSLEALVEPIESQAYVGNCAGISMLMFPKYPNVEIDVFNERNLIAFEKLNARSDLKCLIVVSTSHADRKAHQFREFQFINKLNDKYDKKLAIGGIVIDEINYFPNNLAATRKVNKTFYGMAFSGPNVRACSLLIKTVTPEDTERKFREFRQNLNFDPNLKACETIGFLFVCTGRGMNIQTYPSSNVEASLFRKVFPGVKLMGAFGQGEYGHNYWPSLTPERRRQLYQEFIEDDSADDHEMWHFYTSILVLVNLPKK
jgi:hypothetical protein